MKDKGNQYDNMTHLQLGLIQKNMPVCMNFEQTMKFLPLFKIIIDMTKSKSEKLTTYDIDNFEKDSFEKDMDSFELLKKTIFLCDSYNHIVAALFEGYIVPILPTSYDYNELYLKNINIMSYYDITPGEYKLENAKNDFIFRKYIFSFEII